ncbi:hypothetical protein BXY66_2012 [Shimia isoporae]|uniref:Uncharacterized protein n=1 Tax=Shimia isoporae TaxID=647720 RepID=A0A4R1NP04_9RHOB|nr:hypothetical protein BXY66_2012 [Shimia isoporae]
MPELVLMSGVRDFADIETAQSYARNECKSGTSAPQNGLRGYGVPNTWSPTFFAAKS